MKSNPTRRLVGAGSRQLALAIAALLAAPFAHATSATWNGTDSALWATSNNWSGAPLVVPGSGDTATFNHAGGGNVVLNLGAGVTIKALLFDTSSVASYIIGGGAVGSQTLTLNDAAALTMNASVANNQLCNASISLGTATGNATGTFTNNSTAGSLTLAGGIVSNSATVTDIKTLMVAGAGATTISGAISNGTAICSLVLNGAGTLTLSGTNSYTGRTTIAGNGTLKLAASNVIPSGVVIDVGAYYGSVVSGGGTLDLNGFDNTLGGLAFGNQTSPLLVKTGAGTLTLNGNISQDSVSTGTKLISGNLSLGGGIRTINNSSTTALSISAVISNGSLTSNGSLVLSGANIYAGNTTLSAGLTQMAVNPAGTAGAIVSSALGTGTLTLGGGGLASDSTTPRTILNPVNFTGGNQTSTILGDATKNGKLTFSGGVDLTNASTHALNLSSDVQFDGIISGSGQQYAVVGSGTLTITNPGNNFSGVFGAGSNFNVTSGTGGILRWGASNVFPDAAIVLAGGSGTVNLAGFSDTVGGIAFGISTVAQTATITTGAGTLTLNGNISQDSAGLGPKIISGNLFLSGTRSVANAGAANPLTITAQISGAAGAGLTNSGGLLVLTAANTYTGVTTASGGTLEIGIDPVGAVGAITSSALGSAGLVFNGGGVSSDGATARTVLNAISFTGAATLGDATRNGGLTFSADAALGTAARSITVNSNAQFDGILSSGAGGGIAKSGPANLTLTGNNTYLGATSVSAGKLVLSGSNAAATGGMSVSGGVAQFNSPAAINGITRNVTVTSPGALLFGTAFGSATDIATALLTRVVSNSSGVIAADNYAGSNFDLSAAGLTNASLGAVGNLTYTGALTPNGTTYRLGGGGGTLTMGNAISGAGYSLAVNGPVILSTSSDFVSTTINAGASLQVNSGAMTNVTNNGAILFDLSGTQTYTGVIGGSGGLTKSGAGQLTLSVPQTYFGTTTINGGRLVLAGGNHTLNINKPLVINSGGTLDIGSNRQYVGTLSGSGGSITGSGTLTVNQPSNVNVTFPGTLDGSVNLTLVRSALNNATGEFNLGLTGASTTTGTLTLIGGDYPTAQPSGYDKGVFDGMMLKDGGTLAGVSSITLNYGTLFLNNNASVTVNNVALSSNQNLGDRVNDAAPIALNGGRIWYIGRASSASTETLGAVSAASGMGIIFAYSGSGGSAELTLTSLARAHGATFNVDGTSLGTAGNTSRIFVSAALAGNLTPVGSGVGIVPGVFSGNQLTAQLPVGYVAGKGFVPVGTAGGPTAYNATLALAAADSNVMNPSASVVASGGQSINSLVQSAAVTFAGPTDLLTIASGMITQPAGPLDIGTAALPGKLTSGLSTGELFVTKSNGAGSGGSPAGDNEIFAVVADNGGTRVKLVLTSYCRDNLSIKDINLRAANTHTGGTVISGGNLVYLTGPAEAGGAAPIPLANDPAQGLVINCSNVTMQTTAQQIAAGNIVTLNGGSVLTLTGTNNTLAGLVFNGLGGKGSTVPTVTGGTTLTLTGAIASTPTDPSSTPLISVALDLNGGTAHDITVAALPEGNFVNTLTPLNGLTISSIIANGGFTKKGAGVLNLTSAACTYAGQLTVEAGVLNVAAVNNAGANGVLGNSALPVILGASGGTPGTLEYTGATATSSKPFTLTGSGGGGFQIDAAAANLTLSGVLDGAGGLTKTGAGTLTLANAANTYTGNTTIGAGTLVLPATAGLKFVVTNAGSNGVTGAGTAILNGSFTLDTSAVSVTSGSWTLVNVASLTETFGSTFTMVGFTPDVDGVTWTGTAGGMNWSFSEATGVLTLGSGSPYQSWAATHISAINPSADATATGDADHDGVTNLVEYAFAGNPLSVADPGKVYLMIADSSFDGDTAKELLLTVAVRAGTPVFSADTSPTATHDGITYTIEGSLTLNGFATKVNVVPGAVSTGLPDLSGSGYEYRSFSLDGSNGLPSKGFLRAKVTMP